MLDLMKVLAQSIANIVFIPMQSAFFIKDKLL